MRVAVAKPDLHIPLYAAAAAAAGEYEEFFTYCHTVRRIAYVFYAYFRPTENALLDVSV